MNDCVLYWRQFFKKKLRLEHETDDKCFRDVKNKISKQEVSLKQLIAEILVKTTLKKCLFTLKSISQKSIKQFYRVFTCHHQTALEE